MPRPTTSFGFGGSSVILESIYDGTRVREESDVDDRHLKDISEYIARFKPFRGRMNGNRAGDSFTPSKWLRKGS